MQREKEVTSQIPHRKWKALVSGLEHGAITWDRDLVADQSPPLMMYFGGRTPRRLFYFVNDVLCRQWVFDRVFPSHWLVLAKWAFPTRQYLSEVLAQTVRHELPLVFVGGLLPLHLVVFGLLRWTFASGRNTSAQVRYGGIDDRWLAFSDKHRRSDKQESDVFLTMERKERKLFDLACELIPDLEEVIGPRSMAILRSGHTLHLEGAVAWTHYGRRFTTHLVDYLDRLPIPRSARRARRQRVGSTTE